MKAAVVRAVAGMEVDETAVETMVVVARVAVARAAPKAVAVPVRDWADTAAPQVAQGASVVVAAEVAATVAGAAMVAEATVAAEVEAVTAASVMGMGA